VSAERLRVIECGGLDGRPVIRRHDERQVGPLFFGPGDANLLCGACTFLLIRGARGAHSIRDAVVQCPNCGSCNQATGAVPAPRPGSP
jgi:hypothetical protein